MILESLQEIVEVVKDILRLEFDVAKTHSDYVPGYEDVSLSFERGKSKRSKTINTCILYADIRNSTSLSHEHDHETMARLYTAFTKSILRIAEYHGAVVRNIIGDRVMLVFPEKDCFKNAIETAISINTVSKQIINSLFNNLNFEVGIGIDYGEMMIVKAGIPKREPERTNYKNLIWIGKPANIASKLTDVANKKVKSTIVKVTYFPYNLFPFNMYEQLFGNQLSPSSSNSIYLNYTMTDSLSEKEFVERIELHPTFGITYLQGKFVSFTKEDKENVDLPILMTEKVFKEFKAAYPIYQGLEHIKLQSVKIKDYSGEIYGIDLIWTNYKYLKFKL